MPAARLLPAASVPALAILAGCAVPAQPPFPASPQRPTFSSDTNTVPEDGLELEAGLSASSWDVFDSPVSLKYGVGRATETWAGWSPFTRGLDGGAPDARGQGDLVLGLRHRFLEADGRPFSAAFQTSLKLPTASERDGLGTGETDAYASAIASGAFRAWNWTAFYRLGRVGDPDGAADTEHALALVAGWPVTGVTSAFVEVTGRQRHADDFAPVFTTAGLAIAETPARVWDVSFTTGLNDDAPRSYVAVGVTLALGRVGQRHDGP